MDLEVNKKFNIKVVCYLNFFITTIFIRFISTLYEL